MPVSVPDAGTDSASHFSIHHPNASSVNLRNPLPLSAAQEAQVKDTYYRNVRQKCAPEIAEFAKCAKGRTVTATWTCRAERLAMNSCMIKFATREEEDRAREEWFAGIRERRAKKAKEEEDTERRRLEVVQMTRKQEEKERLERERQADMAKSEGKKKGWFG